MVKLNIPQFVRPEGFGWIYFLYHDGVVVYIGQTVNDHPMVRVSQHFNDKVFDAFDAFSVPIEDLTKREYDLIREHKPNYNISGINGKSYSLVNRVQVLQIEREADTLYPATDAVVYWSSFLTKRGFVVSSEQRAYLIKNITMFLTPKPNEKRRLFYKSTIIEKAEQIYNDVKMTLEIGSTRISDYGTARFNLNKKRANGFAYINMFFHYMENGVQAARLKVAVPGVKIKPDFWDKNKQRVLPISDSPNLHLKINSLLDEMSEVVLSIYRRNGGGFCSPDEIDFEMRKKLGWPPKQARAIEAKFTH